MKKTVVVAFDENEQLELARIIIDRDQQAALAFLKEYVARRIDRQTSGGCKPVFEWRGKEPAMLRDLKAEGTKEASAISKHNLSEP